MDQRTKILIERIIEDSVSESFRTLEGSLSQLQYELGLVRSAERKEQEARDRDLPPAQRPVRSDIRGYSSDIWVHLAGNFFRPCAISLIEELSGKIRECSSSNAAGEMYEAAVAEILRNLDEKYEDRFDRERPFLWEGSRLPVPPYWASERPDIERKAQIEALKFDTGSQEDGAQKTLPANPHAPISPSAKSQKTRLVGRSRGPEPRYKDRLYKIFNKHPSLVNSMTERALHDHVRMHWSGDEKSPSTRTVAKYRAEWENEKEQRLRNTRAAITQ